MHNPETNLWKTLKPGCGYVHIVDRKLMAREVARLLARQILEEYDASTVDEVDVDRS